MAVPGDVAGLCALLTLCTAGVGQRRSSHLLHRSSALEKPLRLQEPATREAMCTAGTCPVSIPEPGKKLLPFAVSL